MRGQDLTHLVAEATPVKDADLNAFALEAAEAELLDAVMAAPPPPEHAALPGRLAPVSPRVSRGRTIGAIAVAAAVIAGVILVGNASIGGDDHPAFAAEAIQVAEANPRLLVTEPGWSVTRADEFTTSQGEMIFSDGQDDLELFWNPADQYGGYLRDRTADSSAHSEIDVLGQRATMFRYDDTATGSPDFTTVIPPQGKTFIEVRGDALGTEDAYLNLLQSLEPADVDTWLGAMPASVVQPTDRAATVDEMLHGIPIPPGFDVDALKQGTTVSDRYQLGANVAGSVACAWLDRWTAAARSGDRDKARESRAAMATSRHWPILQEMNAQGGYPQSIWDWRNRKGDSGLGRETTRNYNPELGCRHIGG